MKTAAVFNRIKTPEDWKSNVRAYKNMDLDRAKENIKRDMGNHRKVRRPLSVILIAAAIMILSCGTVLAYDAISGNFNFEITRAIRGIFEKTDDSIRFELQCKTNDGSAFIPEQES